MNSVLNIISGSWSALRTRVYAGIITLFVVRLLMIMLNLQTNLGELWRPLMTIPEWGGWFAALLFVPILMALHKIYPQLSPSLKNRFLGYYAVCYLLMAFFNNLVDRRCYLFHVFDGRLDMQGLQSLLVMDMFFQAPYIFWCLCLMALSLFLARKSGNDSLIVVLWAIPFAAFSYYYNNLTLVYFGTMVLACLYGYRFNQGESARKLFLFHGLAFAAILLYMESSSIIYRNSWIVAVILLPLVWVPGYWLIRQCEEGKTQPALALTWLVPVISGGLLSQVLYNAPLGKSLFNFWFIFASLNFAGSTIVAVSAAFILAAATSIFLPKHAKLVFTVSTAAITVFYLIDGVLLYKNGLRLSLAVIRWSWGWGNFYSIFQTAVSLLGWQSLVLFITFLLLPYGLFKRAEKRNNNRQRVFSTTTVVILLIAQLSLISYQLLTSYPVVLKDSTRVFLSSLPMPAFLAPPRPSLDSMLKDFAKYGVPISGAASAPVSLNPPTARRKNIVLIILESTSNSYLSLFGYKDLTWPKMATFQKRMEIFPFFFSNFPESSNADFAVMSGLFPPSYLFLRQITEFHAVPLAKEFKAAGYDCSMFFSGFIGDTGLSSLYRPGSFARLYDGNSLPGSKREDGWVWGVKEHVVVDKINDLLVEKAKTPDQPFFICYRNIFPHSPFDRLNNAPAHFPEDDYYQGSWLGRFKNCLLYQDEQLARVLTQIDKVGLREDTIIVIAGDHGTMLGENDGRTGHGWNLSPELTNVPFIIIRPEETGPLVNNRIGSQVDILPTLLALAGIDNTRKSFIQGRNLKEVSQESAGTTVYFGSLIHRAMIQDNHYFLFPIEETADAKVFELSTASGSNRFTQLASWSAEDLWAKYNRINKFHELQKQLLNNIEYYENELSKRK